MALVALLVLMVAVLAGASPSAMRTRTHHNAVLQELQRDPVARRAFCAKVAAHGGGRSCRVDGQSPTLAAEQYMQRHGRPDAKTLQPVILMPGLAGSGLQAEIDKTYKPAWNCFKNWSWWGIWVNIYEITAQTCWFDNLQLHYHPNNDSFTDNPGVTLRPNDFGGLNGVNKLDHFDDLFGLTDVYQPLIENLESMGYEGGKNMFGAPYDWRMPVNKMMAGPIVTGLNLTYEQALLALIEKAYSVNKLPVHLITHSMGGPTMLYFLNRRTQAWRDQYVKTFIPIAGPWAGAVKALKSMISGDNLGLSIPLLDWSLLSMKDLTRNFRQYGGGAFLVPDSGYYPLNQAFVRVLEPSDKNYTASTLVQLFQDLNAPITAELINDTKTIINDLVHPGVNAYCLYGYGHPTEIHLTYKSFPKNPNDVNQPVEIDDSDLGDGTVPLFSLVECKNWLDIEHTTHKVNCREYKLQEHSQILRDAVVHLDILEIVTDKSDIKGCNDTDLPMFVKAKQQMLKYRV